MIFIGTAGYSYRDWIGPFYPEGMKNSEMLAYYAREFMFTEVNSTYYAMPNRYLTGSLVKKTPAGFQFVIKAHQSMTHQRFAGKGEYALFRESLQPIVEAGKLGGVLVQFPYSFHFTTANRDYLKRLAGEMAGLPVAVEFRNQKWINQETFVLLRNEGLAYVCVDEPDLQGLVRPVVAATAGFGYVRFHGRNAARWYDHKESYERYNYLYSEEELAGWVPRLRELEAKTGKIFVSLNNHYQGQAVRNARMIRELLR